MHGDLVLAEPAARRVADALARAVGLDAAAVEVHRRPASLSPLLQDLRTFSLFATGKVLLAVDSAVFADRNAAGELIDDAADVVPLAGATAAPSRAASGRRPRASSRRSISSRSIPTPASPSGRSASSPPGCSKGARRARERAAGRAARSRWRSCAARLAGLLDGGPARGSPGDRRRRPLRALARWSAAACLRGHALVLAESARGGRPSGRPAAGGARRRADGRAASSPSRGSWQGLDLLAGELERQTGVGITPDAMAELARRTLRQESDKSGRTTGGVDADSTARFAGRVPQARQPLAGERADRPQAGRADRGGPRRGGRLAAPRRHRRRPRRRGARPPAPAARRSGRRRWPPASPSSRCSPRSAASSSPSAA